MSLKGVGASSRPRTAPGADRSEVARSGPWVELSS